MFRRAPKFVLATIAAMATAHAAPLHSPQAEVIERLAPALATHDPVRLTMAYRAMGDYALPAAGIVEATVNQHGYRLLDGGEVDAAIALFELNVKSFPDSANAWDSLAEAVTARGDHALAMRFYRRSLELDPQNRDAARHIEQWRDAPRLSSTGAFQ